MSIPPLDRLPVVGAAERTRPEVTGPYRSRASARIVRMAAVAGWM